MRRVFGLIALALFATGSAQAASSARVATATLPAPAARIQLPDRDHAARRAEDEAQPRSAPLRYGVSETVAGSALPPDAKAGAKALPAGGEWSTLPDGRSAWRLAVKATGALGLEFGFRRMFLPQGAELWFRSADGKHVQGPYTDADNTRWGGFRSGVVPGEEAFVELVVPDEMKRHVVLELDQVTHAYRDVLDDATLSTKSLSCEIDVACPEGDAYRDQIRAVARYTFQSGSGGFLCTGQALNDAAKDRKRYFHTAQHCIRNQTQANTMVLYWKYQSPTCRSSATSGTPINPSTAVVQTGGALLRATYGGTDVSLVELNNAIPAGADVFFAGWDVREVLPSASAVIHHANGDEKRISLDFDPPVGEAEAPEVPGDASEPPIDYLGGNALEVTYDRGTTEGGSSGAALFSAAGRVIGQLGGGPAGSCSTGITDAYGWLAQSWAGGGTAATRL